MEYSPACTRFKVMKAESLCYLSRLHEAQELAKYVFHGSPLRATLID